MLKLVLSFVLITFGFLNSICAQTDSIFYFSRLGKQVLDEAAAWEYFQIKQGLEKNDVTRYYKSEEGAWQQEQHSYQQINDSTYQITDAKNNLKIWNVTPVDSGYNLRHTLDNQIYAGFSRTIYPFIREGTWTFYKKNQKLSEYYYQNNKMMGNKLWNEDGSEYYSDVYNQFDTPLLFNGRGYIEISNWISSHIKYPRDAIKLEITGTVIIQFVVTNEGKVDGIRIKKGVYKSLDEEAKRVVALLPNVWTLPSRDGKTVHTLLELPIIFRLE